MKNSAASHTASGIRLLQSGDTAAAKAQFSAAIAAEPHSADALTWRGISENQLSEYRAAAADFEAALRLRPDAVSAQYNLALAFIHLEKPDQAIEMLRRVLAARPGALEPEYNLALLLEQKHATAEAIDHLEAAHKAQPADSAVVQHLSLDLIAVGRIGEAEKLLSTTAAAAPPESLLQASESLLKAGDARNAIPLLERLRARQPDRDVDSLLARALIATHEDSRAIALLQPYEASDATGETPYLIGLAQSDMGATQEAVASLQRALHANPHKASALYHLGQIESGRSQALAQAAEHLQAALRLDPGNVDYALALGRVLLEANDARKAMNVLGGIQAAGSRAGERDLLLGIAQIIVTGPRQATATLQRAIAEDSSLALSHDMLGFCYFSQGRMSSAAAAYARASDLAPSTVAFARSAAIAYEHANDTDRALVFARRAAASSEAGARDHEILGRLLAKAGRPDDAVRELTRAVSIDPNLEPAYFLLGRTLMHAGDRAQAKIWLDRLQELKSRDQRLSSAAAGASAAALDSSTLLRGGPVAQEPQDGP